AMMTNDMNDTTKLSHYINEARVMGIEVLPPDVNESAVNFAPAPFRNPKENGAIASGQDSNNANHASAIRFGLAAIKGVGEVAVEAILKARNEVGRFNSLAALCEHVDTRTLSRKVLEALIKCGACDSLGQTRA